MGRGDGGGVKDALATIIYVRSAAWDNVLTATRRGGGNYEPDQFRRDAGSQRQDQTASPEGAQARRPVEGGTAQFAVSPNRHRFRLLVTVRVAAPHTSSSR